MRDFDILSSNSGKSDLKVTPKLRVVPCGSSGDMLRLTVLVTLEQTPTGGDGLSLRSWPTAFAALLLDPKHRFDISVDPIRKDGGAASSRTKSVSLPDALRRAFGSSMVVADLTKLWANSITVHASDPAKAWKNLYNSLNPAAEHRVNLQSVGTGTAKVTYSPGDLDNQGQFKTDNAAKPGVLASVIAVPQTDAGVAFEYSRAERLLHSLQGKGNAQVPEELKPVKEEQWDPALGVPDGEDRANELRKAYRLKELNDLQGRIDKLRDKSAAQISVSAVGTEICDCPRLPTLAEGCLSPGRSVDAAAREEAMRTSRAAAEHANWPQYSSDAPDQTVDFASQAYFTLQSTPSLARAFLFAIDLTVPAKDLFPNETEKDAISLAHLSVSFSGGADGLELTGTKVRTLCKFRRRGKERLHFWPASQAERLAWENGEALHPASLTQFDAVTVMSSGWPEDRTVCLPRYDLSSLDIRAALDARPEAGATTALTAGLTVLNRTAMQDIVARIAARKKKAAGGGTFDLDADDLTIGHRLMIGLYGENGSTDWRPLDGRTVEFGTSGDRILARTVEQVLGDILGDPSSDRRIAIDSAFATMANRMVPLPGENNREAIADEVYATWDGGPMGVDCTTRPENVNVADDALSFGRTLGLPRAEQQKPHRMRYGWPYRFAMLPVFSGGMSLAADEMPRDTPKACEGEPMLELLFYPPSCPPPGAVAAPQHFSCMSDGVELRPFFRLLRQTQIMAPVVVLPEGQALRLNGPMGPEVGRDIVVRSLTPRTGKKPDKTLAARNRPAKAQRLILVPTVTQNEAGWHGLLDPQRHRTRPQGAYDFVRRADNPQTFPVTLTRYQTGFDGKPFFLDRRIGRQGGQAKGTTPDVPGDSVWADAKGTTASSYFPDPTARKIAIRVRRQGTGKAIGQVRTYDVRAPSVSPMQPLPVLLTVIADRSAKLADMLPDPAKVRTTGLNLDDDNDVRRSGRTALDVTMRVPPGERLELDLWFVPDPKSLAHDMALTQSFGVYLAQSCGCGFEATRSAVQAGLAKLKDHLTQRDDAEEGDDSALQALADWLALCPNTTDAAYVAPGGVAAPSNQLLKDLAAGLAAIHAERPLPEIASILRIGVTHATDRVETAPELSALTARRAKPGARLPEIDLLGETGLVLEGTVTVDLGQCDTIEVWGRMALPGASDFDDQTLGRSLNMRQSGTWPDSISTEKDGTAYRSAEDIFGFAVDRQDRTSHKKTDVLLLRIEAIPPNAAENNRIALGPYFLGQHGNKGRISHRHTFPDGKARAMTVWVNALSRTAEQMSTVDRVAGPGDAWVSATSLKGYVLGEMVEAEPLSRVEQACESDRVDVVLPATVRPAVCDARAPVPVFRTQTRLQGKGRFARQVATRSALVRIGLGRGWFSSGENERLGIVLWPPEPDAGNPAKPGTAWIEGRGMVDLAGFLDSDLGPGGRFVSRRGGDPVRAGCEETRLFLSREDFSDLGAPDSDLGFVHSAWMPVDLPAGGEAAAEGQLQPPLKVALVTAVPRFDVEREEWYVDLALRPGLAPDGFVRLGLVRYQEAAAEMRRVSLPATQWAQPMADRTLTARLDDKGGLQIGLVGTAPTRRAQGQRVMPRMRLALFQETSDAESRPLRRQAEATGPDGASLWDHPVPARFVDTKSDLLEWKAYLPPETLADLRAAPGKSFLYAEEFEEFQSATYPKEPAPLDGMPDRVETGPRFAEVIHLDPLFDNANGTNADANAQ